MKLLNPGPVTLTSRVRQALAGPDLCHREREYGQLQDQVRKQLCAVYDEPGYSAVILTGSGTAAVEAMVGTFVPKHGHALVAANGVYGERMAQMLAAQGKQTTVVAADWTQPIDLATVEKKLQAGEYSHVMAVHHETTTGRLNDLAELARVCRNYSVPILLDGVSSFGGEEIRFEEWNIEACAATANKCLHGVPGISFALARTTALERPTGATSVYLDLANQYRLQDQGSTPFTQSVQVLYALNEALNELREAGGWKVRHRTYEHRSARVRGALGEMGISLLLEDETAYSQVLTSFQMPNNLTYAELHDSLKSAGFVIYAGQGKFSGEVFRIAVMGDLSDTDITKLIEVCGNQVK